MSCAQVALVPLVFAAAHQEQMVHVPLAAGTFAAPPGGSRCKRYSSQLLVGGCCCCRAANACPHRSHVAPECCGVAIDDHAAAQIVVGGGRAGDVAPVSGDVSASRRGPQAVDSSGCAKPTAGCAVSTVVCGCIPPGHDGKVTLFCEQRRCMVVKRLPPPVAPCRWMPTRTTCTLLLD